MHQFKTEQFLPITKRKAWDFFSSPKNLSLITPPEMDFTLLNFVDKGAIYEGMKIDYRVKPLFGLPLKWRTNIIKVDELNCFVDKQEKGPYKIWEHKHTFIERDGGVLMLDLVIYQLPFGFLGKVVNTILVKGRIARIFLYRKKVLESLFK